jgi:hypothetical protein
MLHTGGVTETQVEAPREERQPWRFQRMFGFLSGCGVLEQLRKKQQFMKANTTMTEVPLFEHADGLIFDVIHVVKTGVWHVQWTNQDDLFSVARGSEASWMVESHVANCLSNQILYHGTT